MLCHAVRVPICFAVCVLVQAKEYEARIRDAIPAANKSSFTPLMTLYLTDNTTPEDVAAAKEAGIVAYKLYPAGATTNSGTHLGRGDEMRCGVAAVAAAARQAQSRLRQLTS